MASKKNKKPWFKASQKAWYTTVRGKRVHLCGGKSKHDMASYKRAVQIMAQKVSPDVDWRLGDLNTVADLAARFMEVHVSKMKGAKVARNFVGQFVERWGRVKIVDVCPLHLTAFLKEQTWADNTIFNACTWVQALFNWGVKQGLITKNPVKGVRRPKQQSRGASCVITDEEHEALLRAAGVEGKRILQFLYDTGCRPSELRLARREHYHPEMRAIVFKDEAKTENRVVYLSEACVRIVEEMLDRGRDFIFMNGGRQSMMGKKAKRPFTRGALEVWFNKILKKAGVTREDVSLYSYRHKLCTDCIKKGMNLLTVAKIMGHTSTKQIERTYAHLLNKDVSQALDGVR